MNGGELLFAFRNELADRIKPLLWSDAEIYGYADDAQKLFVRLIGGIGDASSQHTQLPLSDGQEWVPLSPLILKVRDAYRTDDGRPVSIINYEDLAADGIRFDGRAAVRVDAIILGMEPGRVRLYPIPRNPLNGFIQLVVDRLPQKNIVDDDSKIEIAEQHHINLLMWMKHRAYGRTDADTYDARKSLDFQAAFYSYCAAAKREKERALHKTRIVRYGGIGGSNGRSTCHW